MFRQSLMIDPDNSFLDFPFVADPVPDPEFLFPANNMDPYHISSAAVAAAVSTSAPTMQSPPPPIIYIIGAQSTGKSTLVDALEAHFRQDSSSSSPA